MFSEIVCLLFRKAQRTTEIAYIAMGSLGLTGPASSKGFYHAGIGFFFCLFCFSVEEEKHCYPNCHNFNLNSIDAYTCKHIYLHILYEILGSHSLILYGFSNILNVAYPHFYL